VRLLPQGGDMQTTKLISASIALAILSGCASTGSVKGPKGPEIVSSGQADSNGQYAEVGVRFTSIGDLTAVFSPKRWTSPIATGGTLSWLNPKAWREDAGRTGRILLGEAVLIGGAAAIASSDGGNSSGTGTVNAPPADGSGGGDGGSGPTVPGGNPPSSPF